MHYKLYRSDFNKNRDLDDYKQTCEDYISMFDKENIKAIWFFPGPAPPQKLDTLIDRQRDRYKDAIKAFFSEDFQDGFLHQMCIIDIFKSILKKHNQEIIYTTGEIDEYLFLFYNNE